MEKGEMENRKQTTIVKYNWAEKEKEEKWKT